MTRTTYSGATGRHDGEPTEAVVENFTPEHAPRIGTRVLIPLTVSVGGGSLVLFAYFLLFGSPVRIGIAHSHAARLTWDSILCLVFFLQHSGMVRRSVRERLGARVAMTYYPAIYSVASGIALLAVILLWQPTDHFLFRLHGPARWLSACLAGLAIAGFAWGVYALHGFDPFGTLPLKAHLRGAPAPSSSFVVGGPYRYIRHPLYFFMLLLIWSTPRLSTDQFLFNLLWTAWIVVATKLEERDLLADFGQTYHRYQLAVPMLIPSFRFSIRQRQSGSAA